MELYNDKNEKIYLKIGRYGIYLQGVNTNTNIPDEFIPSEMNFQSAQESLSKKTLEPTQICAHP